MHDRLVEYINNHLANRLTEGDIEALKEIFTPKKLRKRQFFLQEGEVCKAAGFVVKGALKQYTVDASGKENVIGLFIENWWAGDRESMSHNTPSPYFIDAVEPTELLVFSKNEEGHLLEQIPFLSELSRALTERQAYQLMRRVHAAHTFTAEQRLADLEKNYPEFLQRFPQHIIASYLGMSKETLSRIRSHAKRK